MIEIKIQYDDLLKWGEQLEEFCKDVPMMFSSVLNKLGNSALETSIDYLSAQTGLDNVDVRNATLVLEATPQDLIWAMDARSVTLEPSPNWARPWQAPGDNTFSQQQLLRVVTSGDGRVCEICAAAAEKPWTVEDINAAAAKWKDFQPPYPVVGERSNLLHPNCLLPGAEVQGNVIAASKSFYAGEAVEIVTRVGTKLALTVNHPVFTAYGMVKAGALREGMKLVTQKQDVRFVAPKAQAYQAPVVIEDVFCSLKVIGSCFIATTVEDFYGDARFINGDVEIVTADRRLLRYLQSSLAQRVGDFSFVMPNVEELRVAGFGSRSFHCARESRCPRLVLLAAATC